MKIFIVSVLIIVFFTLTELSAQPALPAAVAEEEPPAIASESAKEDTGEKKGVTLFGEMSLKEHRIFVNPGGQDEMRFIPNAPLIITGGIEIFGNELFLRSSVKSEDPQGRNQGSSDYFNFQSTQRISSMGFRVYYDRYKGFYIDNVLTPDGNFFIFPDMESIHRGAEAIYYMGYPPRSELFSQFESGSEHRFVKWGGSLGLLYDETALHNIPQNSVFPGGTGSPFSDAGMTTFAPRLGGHFMMLSDLDGRLGKAGLLYWDASVSFGYGNTRLDSIDRGRPKSERLNTINSRFTLDMGLRQQNATAGLIVSDDAIILNDGGNIEFDSFEMGFYVRTAF